MTDSDPNLIPTTIVAGYLGAGKTSLINYVLSQKSMTGIAVLVNDFGSLNIDADLIMQHDGKTISLNNGCVCCSIADDLGAALDQVRTVLPPPEKILIEASGVANPRKIAYYGQGWPGITLDAVIVLVDGEQVQTLAKDKFVGATVCQQLGAADILILNKSDLLDRDALAATQSWLRSQAPNVPIVVSEFGVLDINLLFAPAGKSLVSVVEPQPDHQTDYLTFVWRAGGILNEEKFAAIFTAPIAGLFRAKGFVEVEAGGRKIFQLVGSRHSISLAPSNAQHFDSEIVFIGARHMLNQDQLIAALDNALV